MQLKERDSRVVWHPFSPQKTKDIIPIVKGDGALLYDGHGKTYLDVIASWWVNLHGHGHPYIAEKVAAQARQLEQVIFAGFTHEPAVELAERLIKILPGPFSKIFYSDNGSTSTEVALKIALQYLHNLGTPKKKIIAFKEAYHGDTFGAMSVSERDKFTTPFTPFLFDVAQIPAPEKGLEQQAIEQLKEHIKDGDVAAFIFEPLVQGAAGMRMYAPEALDELLSICKEHGVLSIADEVMTGFGRTGKLFACDYLRQKPDIICLSKGLTGGTMAMGITSVTENIFQSFLSKEPETTFYHGHSFTANPLACSASLASLDLLLEDKCQDAISTIERKHNAFLLKIEGHPAVKEVRHRGTILAVELKTEDKAGYFNDIRFRIYDWFMERGILMRPMGNVFYLIPPYCITEEQLDFVYKHMQLFLDELTKENA